MILEFSQSVCSWNDFVSEAPLVSQIGSLDSDASRSKQQYAANRMHLIFYTRCDCWRLSSAKLLQTRLGLTLLCCQGVVFVVTSSNKPQCVLTLALCIPGQVWSSAAQVADAYQIGRLESSAALNLHSKVDPAIVDRLNFLVRQNQLVFLMCRLAFS